MRDLIDRQEVIETLKKTAGVGNRAIEKIEALPSARKKGYWVYDHGNGICSECGNLASPLYFCPWCGTDMR